MIPILLPATAQGCRLLSPRRDLPNPTTARSGDNHHLPRLGGCASPRSAGSGLSRAEQWSSTLLNTVISSFQRRRRSSVVPALSPDTSRPVQTVQCPLLTTRHGPIQASSSSLFPIPPGPGPKLSARSTFLNTFAPTAHGHTDNKGPPPHQG